jgi:hypothetical protein
MDTLPPLLQPMHAEPLPSVIAKWRAEVAELRKAEGFHFCVSRPSWEEQFGVPPYSDDEL